MKTSTDDRGIENGDYVTIDFQGKLNGEPIKDLKGEDVLLEIGSNRFLPGFEEKLIGHENGRDSRIHAYHCRRLSSSKRLPEKKWISLPTIKGIKFKKVPELNEEFIKNFDKYQSLDQLRDDVRLSLEEEAKARAKSDLRKKNCGQAPGKQRVRSP